MCRSASSEKSSKPTRRGQGHEEEQVTRYKALCRPKWQRSQSISALKVQAPRALPDTGEEWLSLTGAIECAPIVPNSGEAERVECRPLSASERAPEVPK